MVGVEDEYPGETVKAYVARKSAAKVSEEGLIEVRTRHMEAHSYPHLIEFLDDQSETTIGALEHELRAVNL